MPSDDDRLWFTRVEAAALCDLSPRQFDEVVRPRIKDGERGTARTLRFNGPAVVKALLDYRKPKSADDPDGIFFEGPDSPALERWRIARAKLAERDVDEREGTVIRINLMRDALRAGTTAMRATGDRLTRGYGNEAGEIFNEGVAEFEAAAIRVIRQADVSSTSRTAEDGRDDADPNMGVGDADAPPSGDQ
jgi:hypothetical protein